jgi:hypothetical protein
MGVVDGKKMQPQGPSPGVSLRRFVRLCRRRFLRSAGWLRGGTQSEQHQEEKTSTHGQSDALSGK